MKKDPDFFLSAAGEHEELASPRACWIMGRLKDQVRDDHMLITIDPPLIGQRYGFGDHDITDLIISARYEGSSLFSIKEWPCHVYIARILDQSITKKMFFTRNQVEVIAWGAIFRTLSEAKTQAEKF